MVEKNDLFKELMIAVVDTELNLIKFDSKQPMWETLKNNVFVLEYHNHLEVVLVQSIDKGRRYKRRKESTGKKVVSSLDFQEDNTGAEKINTAGEVNAASIEVNTASKVNTGSIELNTVIEQDSTAGENKGQREGKAPMLSEETPKKTKEQILQEEASLAEAIRLDSLQREEEAEQIHLDALLAQRIAEEEELTAAQQGKEKSKFQRAMLGVNFKEKDFARKCSLKRFGEGASTKTPKRLIEDKDEKAKMDKPTKTFGKEETEARKGMHTSVDENVSEDSDKVDEQEETNTGTETTKDSLKRFGEELQTKTLKRLKRRTRWMMMAKE
ncbi:hypothetical protein Tco_0250409 [Tanacetum coccineum]